MHKFAFLFLVTVIGTFAAHAQQPPVGFLDFDDGRMNYEARRYKQAITAFDKAIAKQPGVPSYYLARARTKNAARDLAGALADVNKSIELLPESAAYALRASVRMERDDHAEAIKDLELAASLAEPMMETDAAAEYLLYLSYISKDAGEDAKAAAYLKRSKKLKSFTAEELVSAGEAHRRHNVLGLAFLAFTSAIEASPKSAKAYIGRGITNARLQNDDQALEDFDTAIKFEPNGPMGHFYRASLLLDKKGDANGALASAEKGLSLVKPADSKDRVFGLQVRAEIYCALGKKAEATKDEAELAKLGRPASSPCK